MDNFTPKEKETLDRLLRGYCNKDIAKAMSIEVVTVKLHMRGICRKLGAKNRTQAALLALKHKLGQNNVEESK